MFPLFLCNFSKSSGVVSPVTCKFILGDIPLFVSRRLGISAAVGVVVQSLDHLVSPGLGVVLKRCWRTVRDAVMLPLKRRFEFAQFVMSAMRRPGCLVLASVSVSKPVVWSLERAARSCGLATLTG